MLTADVCEAGHTLANSTGRLVSTLTLAMSLKSLYVNRIYIKYCKNKSSKQLSEVSY